MQQPVNSQQCLLIHTVKSQNNKPVLHLKSCIMTSSNCVQHVFSQKRIKANCKLQNIYNVGCKL